MKKFLSALSLLLALLCAFSCLALVSCKDEPEDTDVPRYDFALEPESCARVDDFGAVGDGVTDCSPAIQKALDSGKPYIFFGNGHYLVNSPVRVPATVKLIDFMFCDLFSGEDLKRGLGMVSTSFAST